MKKIIFLLFLLSLTLCISGCSEFSFLTPTTTPTTTFTPTKNPTATPTQTSTYTMVPSATFTITPSPIPEDYVFDLNNAKGQKITIIQFYRGEKNFDEIPIVEYDHFTLSGAFVTYDGVEITITYNGISHTEKSDTGLLGLEQSNVDHVVYIRLNSPETLK